TEVVGAIGKGQLLDSLRDFQFDVLRDVHVQSPSLKAGPGRLFGAVAIGALEKLCKEAGEIHLGSSATAWRKARRREDGDCLPSAPLQAGHTSKAAGPRGFIPST